MARKFEVVCINDKRRPAEVPAESWVSEPEIYTVTEVSRMAYQPGVLGYLLEEVKLPENCPYKRYDSSRFRPATEEDRLALEAANSMLQELLETEVLELI